MKIVYFLLTSMLLLSSCGSSTKEQKNANYGINPNAIKVDVIAPEHGMADPHAWVENESCIAPKSPLKLWITLAM